MDIQYLWLLPAKSLNWEDTENKDKEKAIQAQREQERERERCNQWTKFALVVSQNTFLKRKKEGRFSVTLNTLSEVSA